MINWYYYALSIIAPLKKKNRLLPKEFNDTRLILCDNYTAQTMSGFTTSFIIIPQLASDHRAVHEYDWPMTINTVYTWLGHEELRNAQITAQEWIERFAGIIVEIKKNLPELKTIRQLYPLPNWANNNHGTEENRQAKQKYNDVIRLMRTLAKERLDYMFTFLETYRLGYNLPGLWLSNGDKIDHRVTKFESYKSRNEYK